MVNVSVMKATFILLTKIEVLKGNRPTSTFSKDYWSNFLRRNLSQSWKKNHSFDQLRISLVNLRLDIITLRSYWQRDENLILCCNTPIYRTMRSKEIALGTLLILLSSLLSLQMIHFDICFYMHRYIRH